MKKLIKGIVDFRKKSLQKYRDKFSKLAMRQSPDALFIACCDSRVVPNVFASSDPGDLFVLRNIGNIVPPYQIMDFSVHAAIEFAVLNLEVQDIIICGHSECGAMHDLMNNCRMDGACVNASLKSWLQYASLSYEKFEDSFFEKSNLTPCNVLSRVNVLQQLDNLMTYPMVAERVHSKRLGIHGWWFDLATADIYHYDQKSEDFILIDEKEAKVMLRSY